MLKVTVDRATIEGSRDRYPFRVRCGAQVVAAFAKAKDAELFVAWCRDDGSDHRRPPLP
ncbi:MAG: hypothetical protein M3256_08650 [Actinomycetota bacterium]|nr:hypothetical protein [Actinomycetota bacterium]